MKYKCSLCTYESYKREHITRHQQNKTVCGNGNKYVIAIKCDNQFKCPHCGVNLSTKPYLNRHIKFSCKRNKERINNKNNITIGDEITLTIKFNDQFINKNSN